MKDPPAVVPGGEGVRVVIRVRPLLTKKCTNITSKEDGGGGGGLIATEVVPPTTPSEEEIVRVKVSPTTTTASKTTHEVFECDCAIRPEETQADVFRKSGVKELIDQAILGYRCLTFAYGMTGAGKTHTIHGRNSPKEDIGLLPRAIEHIYDDQNKEGSFKVKLSCFEIYQENIIDMLATASLPPSCSSNERQHRHQHHHGKVASKSLPVRENKKTGFYVEGLCVKPCHDKATLLQEVGLALRHRRIGSHHLNHKSNRSHFMITLHFESNSKGPEDGSVSPPPTYGSMTFCDLAGSERLKETGSSGQMRKEAGHINKSLYVLGKVIRGINGNGNPVPYRDNKLTKLLYSSLGGNCKTIMIACVSPSMTASKETIRTLKFAIGVKGIKNYPTIVLNSQEQVIKRLQDEIMKLRLENAQLRQSLTFSPHPLLDLEPIDGFPMEDRQLSANNNAPQEPAKAAAAVKEVKKPGSFLSRIFALRGRRTGVHSVKVESAEEPKAQVVHEAPSRPLGTNIGMEENRTKQEILEQQLLKRIELITAKYDEAESMPNQEVSYSPARTVSAPSPVRRPQVDQEKDWFHVSECPQANELAMSPQATPPPSPGLPVRRCRRAQSSSPLEVKKITPKGPETEDLLSSTWSPPSTSSPSYKNHARNHTTYHKLANRILGKQGLEYAARPPWYKSDMYEKAGLVEKELQRLKGNKLLHSPSVVEKKGPLSIDERNSIRTLVSTWQSRLSQAQRKLDKKDFVF